jgi:hypothetical protein
MNLKRIVKAAFKIRNIALLAAVLIITYFTGYLPFTLVGMAAYVYFVMQTLRSDAFNREYSQEEKLDGIQQLSRECRELYNRLYRRINKNLRQKLTGVLREKDQLMSFFEKNSEDPLKQKIIEQTLNLVIAHINLTYNYSVRLGELSTINLARLKERIDNNNRKLGFLKSYDAVLELTKTIEMDEKLVSRINEERNELEKISVRLDYIESTISRFKHQIISTDSSDPEVADIESVINEAAALDNVLSTSRKGRIKV